MALEQRCGGGKSWVSGQPLGQAGVLTLHLHHLSVTGTQLVSFGDGALV